MKIKVSEIKPNPFRNFEHYPIDKAKVETLKASIQETTFWDNILVRQRNGNYELAYGHHRWIALGELGINEIDIPVRDLSDSVMLKMMANENMDQWGSQPFVIYATVRAVRDYLDSELVKYER